MKTKPDNYHRFTSQSKTINAPVNEVIIPYPHFITFAPLK